ncbi:hypothetical protein B296_00029981, partial [Ensete ventricosum]
GARELILGFGRKGELRHSPSDLAKRVNSGTNPGDLTENVNSGTNPGDLAKRVNSGINHEDFAENVNLGTNPGDLADMVNSGINPEDLAEKVNSGTNLGDLTEKVNSSTNHRDLAERVNLGTNPEDLAERGHLFPGSGGVSRGDPEASSSGASSRPPSLVDARVLRDLEVMKANQDLDMTVTEGSLAVIRGRYSIPAEYGLYVLQPKQRPYSSNAPGMCISMDALEVGLRFPLHPLIEECLRWWRISPNQVACNSWRYLVVLLGEGRGAGIIPTWDLFMTCFHLCKSQGGYYLTARVSFRVSGAPSNNKGWKSRYLFVSGTVWGFRVDWSTHPISNALLYLSEEEFVMVDRLKGILSSSCAIKEMTELWLVKAGLYLTSRGIIMFALFQLSMSFSNLSQDAYRMDLGDLHGMPKMSDGKAPSTRAAAPARVVGISPARWRGLKNSTKVWNDSSATEEFERGLLHPQLAWELYTLPSEVLRARAAKEMVLQELDALKSGGGPKAVVKAEKRASELEQELEKTKQEQDEALQRLEAFEKELSEVWSNLVEIQRLLKEARVRARKMDDELLQSMKAMENARAKLPRQAVDRYKESASFKEGLKRIG